jgi:hypothetical protein
MQMESVRAQSWNELQDLLFAGAWNATIRRYRSPWAFRGLGDASYALNSTLIRLGGEFATLEKHLIRNFKKYAHRDVVARDSVWHWLSVAQHHGLPTRLLDWTHSPMVAMHFATADAHTMDVDGAIWAVNYEEAHRLLPATMRAELDREGANSFTTEMLERAAPSLEHFVTMGTAPFLTFFEPPSIDDRIINQYALFSVLSHATEGLDAWFAQHPSLCRKIVIPSELKWEIRDKLDQSNVTERVLFPGLDGLSRWLARQYRGRN